MSKITITLLVILVILLITLIVLYFTGKKTQKKQEEQKAQIEAAKQTVSMLIIDKKRMPIKNSGLPQFVIDQTPKLMRRSKLPIVKAKVGPKIMTLVCEADIFDQIPVKKEIKAEVSGIYIVGARGLRAPLEKRTKKKGFFKRMLDRANRDSVYYIEKPFSLIKSTDKKKTAFFKSQNVPHPLTEPLWSRNSQPHILHSSLTHSPPLRLSGQSPPEDTLWPLKSPSQYFQTESHNRSHFSSLSRIPYVR